MSAKSGYESGSEQEHKSGSGEYGKECDSSIWRSSVQASCARKDTNSQMVILSAAMVNIRRIRLLEGRKWSEMASGWTSFCDLGRKWLYNFHSITITWLCRCTEVLKPPRWGCSLPGDFVLGNTEIWFFHRSH